MVLLSFVLCVIFSAECAMGKQVSPTNTLLADEAFKLLHSSLYCAPNGSFIYYDHDLGWLHFDSETLPSKYKLPVCNECPVCTEETCSSCVPRPLGAFCKPCVFGEDWPSPENLTIIAPRCLSCLFGWLRRIVQIKPCNKRRQFDWIGWMAGAVKDTSLPSCSRPPPQIYVYPPRHISVYPPQKISVYPTPQIPFYPSPSQIPQQTKQYSPLRSEVSYIPPQIPQQTK